MAAIAVAWWLPLRDSGWLTWLNTLTAAALLVGAVVFDRHRPPRLSVRSMTQFATRVSAGFAGPFLVVRSLPLGAARRNGTSQRAFEVFRGLAIASVPVVIIGALLVQADALFASVLRVDVNAEAFASHAVISGLVALAIAGVVCVGRSGSGIDYGRPGLLGSIELVTVLASLFVLLGAFGLTQLLSTFADVEAILAAEGTTHAEYARSGFFQLLAVAALMLLLLCALRAVARPTVGVVDRARRALGAGVCLLTLLVVAVSIQRLGLYVEAFGQTTLRWYSTAFAWLLGMTFILFAIEHARAAKVMTAAWLGRATVVLVVATLLAVNAINPERRVANHNLTNEATESALDGWYLTRLSADAWPALLAHLDELTATGDTRIGVPLAVIAERCEHVATQPGWGVAGFNLSRARLACPQWSL